MLKDRALFLIAPGGLDRFERGDLAGQGRGLYGCSADNDLAAFAGHVFPIFA